MKNILFYHDNVLSSELKTAKILQHFVLMSIFQIYIHLQLLVFPIMKKSLEVKRFASNAIAVTNVYFTDLFFVLYTYFQYRAISVEE